MRRLAVWGAITLGVLAAALVIGASQQVTVLTPPGESPRPRLHVRVPAIHYALKARYQEAAGVALDTYVDWFGPIDLDDLHIDPAVAWFSPVRRFTIEDGVVEAAAEAYWNARLQSAGDAAVIEGLSAYTRARMMESAFREERVDLASVAAAAEPRNAASRRASLAFHTIERHFGWAVMQVVLAALAPSGRPVPEQMATLLTDHTGRDVSWLLPEAFDVSRTYDYAIERLESAPVEGRAGRFRTVVEVRRHGDAVFSGTAQPAGDAFESGRALRLLVTFTDDSTVDEFWDGRSESKTYVFESAAAVERAMVDPDEVLMLDANPANNVQVLGGR